MKITKYVLALSLVLCAANAKAKEQITLKDVAGRTVTVQVPVNHMVLGEGRFLPTLGILDRKDPTRRIVGMMGEFAKYDPATYAQYRNVFPHIDDIPLIGSSGAISFSVEKAFSVKPDVAVFGLSSGHGPSNKNKTILEQFKAAGIPVVIIDFRIDPLTNTPKSMRLLGQLMGREKEADEFLGFYSTELNRVRDRLQDVKERPSVFMESRVGLMPTCCEAIGQAMMGRFIKWAGGINAFGDLIPGTHGNVNIEHLITQQPDVYIGTAIGSAQTNERFPKAIALGVGTEATTARASLNRSVARTGIAELKAVQSGKAFAIWHHFYNTPMNVVAVQALAKWLHPNVFGDMQPKKTLASYFNKFQPVPLNGVYWTGLKE